MNDQELHDLIALATPVDAETIASLAIDDAAADLCDRIVASPALRRTAHDAGPDIAVHSTNRTRRRRRVVLVLAAAIAALALAGAGWAGLRARTGFFSTGGEAGSGEFIRLDAPDAEQVVDEIAQGIPLPPRQSFDAWKANNLGPDGGSMGGGISMTESGIRSMLEYWAACRWTGYWLDGFNRGDERQMAEALPVLEAIPTWPATVASDGGGVVESLRLRAQGARERNPALFWQDYFINCTEAGKEAQTAR